MTRVSGIGGPAIAGGRAARSIAGASGFHVAGDVSAAESVGQAAAAQPVGLAGMLALQEAETETSANRQGRRQGAAVLDTLRELQHGLLTACGDAQEIARLTALAREPDCVTDPGLAAVLSAIRLRAKIELLRRGVELG